jgi:hypothetical protein
MKSSILYITLYGPLKETDVSEEHVTSFFRVEEQVKQETSVKQVASNQETSVDF